MNSYFNCKQTMDLTSDSHKLKFSSPAKNSSYNAKNYSSDRIENYELFVAGFMKITDNDNVKSLSLSILRGIVPTINAEEISTTRLVHKRNTENSNSKLGYSSIITRLTTIERAKYILSSRKDRNYFSTNEIDKSILNEELLTRMPI